MAAKANRKLRTNYQHLRAALVSRGTSLSRWARENGYPQMTVYDAAKGNRHGATSTRIRNELDTLIEA